MLCMQMRLAKKTTLTLLGAVGCSLVCVSAARAAWSVPVRVASSRVWDYSRPLVATGGAGGGVLVWHREEQLNETLSGIEAFTRTKGSWSVPVVLASGPRERCSVRSWQ